jgi:hypothetical protein|tara:strand:- start:117 stop:296 length:180 start_codon:yes stop_codon:yes gene_type:complete
MKQFENMTIAELKKLTEQYQRLEDENKKLKIKYPTKKLKKESDPHGTKGAQDIIDDLPQ